MASLSIVWIMDAAFTFFLYISNKKCKNMSLMKNTLLPHLVLMFHSSFKIPQKSRGTQVALSVGRLISAQVGSDPTQGSVLKARSLEPASYSVSPSLCAPARLWFVSLSKINKR